MKKSIIIFILICSVIAIIGSFSLLTKYQVIPNYLNIQILEPIQEEPPSREEPESEPKSILEESHIDWKPIIYLYPEKEKDVFVSLDYSGEIFVSYPKYSNGWNVTAKPDGTIINKIDEKEYSYLFWEGRPDKIIEYDMSKGFVVEGHKTAEFLQEKLEEIGLLPNEYNEFIVFWLPKMINNKYNLIHFATEEEYHDRVILNVEPKPDSVLRIFVVFQPLDNFIEINPQKFDPFKRSGFTVVEWGGTEIPFSQ